MYPMLALLGIELVPCMELAEEGVGLNPKACKPNEVFLL